MSTDEDGEGEGGGDDHETRAAAHAHAAFYRSLSREVSKAPGASDDDDGSEREPDDGDGGDGAGAAAVAIGATSAMRRRAGLDAPAGPARRNAAAAAAGPARRDAAAAAAATAAPPRPAATGKRQRLAVTATAGTSGTAQPPPPPPPPDAAADATVRPRLPGYLLDRPMAAAKAAGKYICPSCLAVSITCGGWRSDHVRNTPGWTATDGWTCPKCLAAIAAARRPPTAATAEEFVPSGLIGGGAATKGPRSVPLRVRISCFSACSSYLRVVVVSLLFVFSSVPLRVSIFCFSACFFRRFLVSPRQPQWTDMILSAIPLSRPQTNGTGTSRG